MSNPELDTAIKAVFDGMRESGPGKLTPRVIVWLEDSDATPSEQDIVSAIIEGDGNAPARKAAHMCLARWDSQTEAPWAGATEAQTPERRTAIFDKLDLNAESRSALDAAFPSVAQRDIVIATPGPWDPWYTPERRTSRDFYWNAYRGVLEASGWAPENVALLDESTSDIVGRLADPSAEKSYQSKGLVVGYVQSGKTANFTGIIAKAIDAGYRLIIVLTGTVELLRGQTQRRLDKELVGEENILGGRDRNKPEAVRNVDYIGDDDADWLGGKFLRHGIDINSHPDVPAIKRLTTASGDYKALKAGLDTLDFRRAGELRNPLKPMYDPENLFGTDVRLAVVKKNKNVLEKLLRDLHDVHASLKEIPVLVIDDEADQASVNTTNPKRWNSVEEKDRTAINKLISQILREMPRSQYIGYTATPFANVFVSPSDSEDIFPTDFITALEPSADYMGARQFHDLDPLPDDEPIDASNSNEAAFVRDLRANDPSGEEAEIERALDSFVLSGAIKLWRAEQDTSLDFRHHTMLVHQSVKQSEHKDLADLIEKVWNGAGYSQPVGSARLRALFKDDFRIVHKAREWETLLPGSFDEIRRHVGDAVNLVTKDGSPVVIVNGSKDSDYKAMDFATGRYWRIMVGGTKLSRGFTVEGLTTTYYRRRANAADTLMQMGRWFGYRRGYEDLVRLYIDREAVDARGHTFDLYDAFTAITQDEESFRTQLRRFARTDEEGRPEVRPIDVPPLVFQQLPWLKPTGTNKMYNAVLDFEGDGGILRDFPRQSDRTDGTANETHFDAVRPWLDRLGDPIEFQYAESRPDNVLRIKSFEARIALVDAESVYGALSRFHWTENYSFEPTLRFMRQAIDRGALVDWAVMVPELKGIRRRGVEGVSVQLLNRARRQGRGGFSGSSFRQRAAVERIAGNIGAPGGPAAAALNRATRGAMLLTFAADPASEAKEDRNPEHLIDPIDPRDVATLFSLAMPYKSAPRGRIGFRVIDPSKEDQAIIDAT
jgi:hypothetical protein